MKLFRLKCVMGMIVVISCLSTTTIKAQVNTQDSLALVDLFNSTGGPSWTNHNNWLTSSPVSSWYGIQVNNNNRVAVVEQIQSSAGGTLPNSIGNITDLFWLDLSGFQLNGAIPSSIGNLTKLTYLALNANHFSGGIPSSFGNLSNLNTLELQYNNLSGSIPSSIGNLTKLQFLDLAGNQLSGWIPITFSNLTNMQELIMQENQLSGSLPSFLGNLSHLTTLSLSNNLLIGNIPSSLGNLSQLQELNLSANQLTGAIPSSLGNLTNLTTLNLSNNKLTFAGMEAIVHRATINSYYAPQAIVPLTQTANSLSFSVGGTPVNNMYKWYRDRVLIATKMGDSTYTATSNGKYWVVATNAVATQLTLYSDTINITSLPVTFSSLTATANNKNISINWHTSTELNTSHFIIQHSTDGTSFTDIGTIKAVGSGANGYSFTDTHPANGTNYYRLQSVDRDGASSFSKVVSAEIVDSKYEIVVVPNPVKSVAIIKGNHIALVQVIDNIGRVVKTVTLKDATNPVLSVSGLPTGVYHLRIQTTDGNVSGVGMVKE